MKEIRFSPEKSIELKQVRGASFEELICSGFIGIERHTKREHQNLMLFEHQGYVWVAPYVETDEYYFLKTAFPSRKHTKKYLGGKTRDQN